MQDPEASAKALALLDKALKIDPDDPLTLSAW